MKRILAYICVVVAMVGCVSMVPKEIQVGDDTYIENGSRICGLQVVTTYTKKQNRTEDSRDKMSTWGTRFIIVAPALAVAAFAVACACKSRITEEISEIAFYLAIGLSMFGMFLIAAATYWYFILIALLVGGGITIRNRKSKGLTWQA